MNDQNKKMNLEETPKNEKIELTDDEVEKAAGGKADFARILPDVNNAGSVVKHKGDPGVKGPGAPSNAKYRR